MAADSLRGYVVLGADGVPVGKVEEVLIDLEQGRLSYLQVAAGSDSRQVFVPWRAVRIGSQPPAVRLSIGAEKFRLAPSGEVVFADREEERAFHRFFGVSPYWEGDPAVSPPRPPRNLRIVK